MHQNKRISGLSCIALMIASVTFCQEVNKKKNSFIAYPVGFYLPETGWGGGAAATYNFYFDKNDSISPASQVSIGGAITQNGQYQTALPFNLFWRNRKHNLSGEFSYNDFTYYYYGSGGGNIEGEKALYRAVFPRFRINYLYRLGRNIYGGARWWIEDYEIKKFDLNPEIGLPAGSSGGMSSGPGVVALFDSRDNVYFPVKGWYLELVYHNQSDVWRSDFSFDRYRFDLRHFIPVSSNFVMAQNVFGDLCTGSTPFFQSPALGSGRRGRGFYEGRYRDDLILMYQAEVRGFIYRRWGVAGFFNYSMMGRDVSLTHDHAAAGAGIRFAFDKEKKINLRLDAAIPIGSGILDGNATGNPVNFYFTVNEAF